MHGRSTHHQVDANVMLRVHTDRIVLCLSPAHMYLTSGSDLPELRLYVLTSFEVEICIFAGHQKQCITLIEHAVCGNSPCDDLIYPTRNSTHACRLLPPLYTIRAHALELIHGCMQCHAHPHQGVPHPPHTKECHTHQQVQLVQHSSAETPHKTVHMNDLS